MGLPNCVVMFQMSLGRDHLDIKAISHGVCTVGAKVDGMIRMLERAALRLDPASRICQMKIGWTDVAMVFIHFTIKRPSSKMTRPSGQKKMLTW